MLKIFNKILQMKKDICLLRMNHGNSKDTSLNWYHGKLSRIAAEKVLQGAEDKENGLFLVRESSTSEGDYVASVLHNNEVIHIQIRRHGEDAFFSVDGETITHGLETLIEFYHINSIHKDVRLVKPVIKDPPPHDSRRHGTTNLLHRATKQGNYTIVSELLKCHYRSLDAKNQDGQTAVHLASILGKDDILRKLIQSKANINVRDMAGYTPLHYACQFNHPSTVRILVDEGGADIQIRHTETGMLVDLNIMEWYKASCAMPSAVVLSLENVIGHVPLHEAASNGHSDVVTALLSLNAPAHPRTMNNATPADLAEKNGHIACARKLREYKPPAPRTKKEAWYHGTLDRKEARQVVQNFTDQDGAFLVRYSPHHRGDVLTVQYRRDTLNYPVHYEGGFYFIDSGPYHNSLEHVIDYYTMLSDGLITTLQFPVTPTPKPLPPEIPPNGLSSTLPLRRNKYCREEAHLSSTLGRNAMIKNSRNDPPELGIPDVSKMHSAPLSTLLSGTSVPICALRIPHSTALTVPSPTAFPPNMNKNITNILPSNKTTSTISEQGDGYITADRLIVEELLGEGEFGSVYKGKFTDYSGYKMMVAIKTLRQENIVNDREKFLQEARVMMSLHHSCVVRLVGISRGPPLRMVQELVPLGSMLTYLLQYPERANPKFELKIWASQIASGMKYLEEQRFVHRDLAARNILLASRYQAKISDFGLSRSCQEKRDYYQATQGGRWPIKWYAPEAFNFGTFTSASDVWSFGVTLWEMFSYGQQPYGDLKGTEVTQLVERGERLQKPDQCPDSVYRIMEQCWSFIPRDRPSFTELAEAFASDPDYINVKELLLDSDSNLS